MSEKRFIEDFSYLINYPKHHCVLDRMQQKNLELDEIIGLLNILHQENQELKEENEQLRKELNDCEKFRYTVFKRMGELNDEL